MSSRDIPLVELRPKKQQAIEELESVEGGQLWIQQHAYDVKAIALNLLVLALLASTYIDQASVYTCIAVYSFIPLNLFGVYAAFSLKLNTYFRWMIAFILWVVMVLVFIIVIVVSGDLHDLADERCQAMQLCALYGPIADKSCLSKCKSEVFNQLVGEVILIAVIIGLAALFVIRLMYGLYCKIEMFYERFPDYDKLRMRAVPEDEVDDKNIIVEEDEDYEQKDVMEHADMKELDSAEISREDKTPMLKILPMPDSAFDEKKYAPSSSDESFEDFKSGICAFPGCQEEALDLQCPICHNSDNPPVDSFYCSQDHFNRSWKEHKAAYHKNI